MTLAAILICAGTSLEAQAQTIIPVNSSKKHLDQLMAAKPVDTGLITSELNKLVTSRNEKK